MSPKVEEVENLAARAYRAKKKIPDLSESDLTTKTSSSSSSSESWWSWWFQPNSHSPKTQRPTPIPAWLRNPSEHDLAWLNFGIYKVWVYDNHISTSGL